MKLYHYISSDYKDGAFGGVPRFDYELHKVFPELITISQKRTSINKYSFMDDDIIITDNGLAIEVSLDTKCIIVHHGLARTHLERYPEWTGAGFIKNQDLMVKLRSSPNTWYIACSQFMADEFWKHYKIEDYEIIPHSVETAERTRPNNIVPKIIGDWRTPTKGYNVIHKIRENLKGYEFIDLSCGMHDKEAAYKNIDLYLCLSLHEGNSYSMMDAIASNIPVVTTNVGFGYRMNPIYGISFDWNKLDNLEMIDYSIKNVLNNYEIFKPRNQFLKDISFPIWSKKWKQLISDVQSKEI